MLILTIEEIAQCCEFIDCVLQDFIEDKSEIVLTSNFNCSAN